MALTEFGLISRFFARKKTVNSVTRLGIGDDCALLAVPEGYELAVTTDTMVEGVHFFAGTDPELLGHKLLAVNLSDLASMGSKPVAVTLALTLAQVDELWLEHFARGFLTLAEQYSIDLIGGDTTSGPLTLTAQAMGLVLAGNSLKRANAKPGDLICLTGLLGDAGLGLKIMQGYRCKNPEPAILKLHKPIPRVEAGLKISIYANACIDISDGLTADLGHILDQSHVGACIDWASLPFSAQVSEYIDRTGDWQMPLQAGDDYELCFTISPEQREQLDVDCRQIGVIEALPGLRLNQSGKIQTLLAQGFEHFS